MKITRIAVTPVQEEKLRAYVNITFDDCFVIRGLKVIQGRNGLFVSMPNVPAQGGSFKDMAHPVNAETRESIEEMVIAKYFEVTGGEQPGGPGDQ